MEKAFKFAIVKELLNVDYLSFPFCAYSELEQTQIIKYKSCQKQRACLPNIHIFFIVF